MICVVKIWNGAFHDPIGHDDKKKPSFPARIVRVGQSLHNYKVSWLQGRVVSTFPCFVASSGLVWCLHVDTIQISFYQGCQTPFVKKERGWEVVKHMHSNSDVQGEVATTTRKCPQYGVSNDMDKVHGVVTCGHPTLLTSICSSSNLCVE